MTIPNTPGDPNTPGNPNTPGDPISEEPTPNYNQQQPSFGRPQEPAPEFVQPQAPGYEQSNAQQPSQGLPYAPPVQPGMQQPGMPQQGMQQPANTNGPVPGRLMGILGLVLAIPFSVIGLILSIVGLVQAKKAGVKNVPGFIGLILSVLVIIAEVVLLVIIIKFWVDVAQACADNGGGQLLINGNSTINCSDINVN